MRLHKNTKYLLLVPGLLITAAGCNSARDNNSPGTTSVQTEAATAPVSAEVSDPQQAVRAYVRTVHTVPGAGPVSLAIDGTPVVDNIAFGNASEFVGLHDPKVKINATRDHQITAVNADGKILAGPLLLDLDRGEDVTIVIGGSPSNVTLTPFEHTNRGSDMGQAKLAVLHADKSLPELTLQVDGKARPNDIGYGQVTQYFNVQPGQHTLKVQYDKSLAGIVDVDKVGAPASRPRPVGVKGSVQTTLTQPLNMAAGEVYSVLVYADAKGFPKLRLLEDKFRPALIRAPDANGNA